jgi:hypothetical protein
MEKLQQMGVDRMRRLGLSGEWWENDLYRVLLRQGTVWEGRPIIQLSIRRHDGKSIDPSWREKQQIKKPAGGRRLRGRRALSNRVALTRSGESISLVGCRGFDTPLSVWLARKSD